jgi:poly(hydroxyalkanoate) granule-associated protein
VSNETQTIPAIDRVRTEILSTGRNLWLAGLGAVSEIERESRGVFDRLVERGRPLAASQKQTVSELSDKAAGSVRELGKLVGDTVEYEMKGILRRMGMMTYEDVQALAARLESLSRKLDEIAAAEVPATAAPVTANDANAGDTANPEPRPARRTRAAAARN